jgi:glycosyltransferase involved in cell wall biosynthesis
MVEAMACGTPVVGMDCGSVSEVIEDGVSGFISRSLPELIESVARARLLDRRTCRAYAEARFSACAMADGYEEVYRQATSQPIVQPLARV